MERHSFDCSAVHHQAQAFVPSVPFWRLLDQMASFIFQTARHTLPCPKPREPNAFQCNYFVDFLSAGVKIFPTVITSRSLHRVECVSLERRPYLSSWFLSVADALRNRVPLSFKPGRGHATTSQSCAWQRCQTVDLFKPVCLCNVPVGASPEDCCASTNLKAVRRRSISNPDRNLHQGRMSSSHSVLDCHRA